MKVRGKAGRGVTRVLFIMPDLGGGGAELSLIELLGRLARKRIEPSLFLLKRAGVHLDRLPADVKLSWARGNQGRLRYHLPSLVPKVLVEARGADVIVGAMETTSSYVAGVAASLLGKPMVGWVRTDLDEQLDRLPQWHRRAARWLYPRCEAVVTPSCGSRNSLNRVALVAPSRLRTIHNPVDAEAVRTMAIEPLPAVMQFMKKPFIVGAGWLRNVHKGFDLLVRAHARVRGQGVDHNLVILGEGEDRGLLEQLARSLHVEDSVFLPGFQRNPFPVFKAAVALAAPARQDSLGRIFLEAAALGLPLIGSQASGPAEVLQDGHFGITVPTGNVGALADAMHLLLTDGEAHRRYAQLSLQRGRDYCPQQVASQWEDLLYNCSQRTVGEAVAR